MGIERTEQGPAGHHAALDRIMQIALGFQASKVLLTAVRLGLFTELAAAPLPYEELRSRLGLHPRAARDFFDALVALGLLDRDERGYANTPAAARHLDRERAGYLGGFLEMADARLYRFWDTLADGLRTGEPQNELKDGGEDFFGVLYQDPERLAEFLRAITGLSMRSAHALADTVDWSAHRVVADIGCAEGGTLGHLLLRHPHLRGIGFDLEPVRPHFERRAERFGLADRLEFRGGDFFTDPLPHADVLVFGHILHDWDLPAKRMLLRKAYEALPAGGVVIVYETLVDDARHANAPALLMSLNILIETTGGFDYTGSDCREWLAEAGFADSRVRPLAGAESMVIARK
ncbi:acetylserotonin O-methyltransferase [Streptomyces sp. UNOC14_S4]|uniref:acetylserotonin O-methyltransferase n=1 Tax=Streptomyces sp. UNOC14_S4 TaxID=2872340 RepID=UPI001E36C9EB|nr:acetylserotonin O-methyltransferase [Streptomyces sp. UNOC14_S4]MCC3770383.1 methyltransferase [Streptomyces sp. UNOC14_S4]